LGLASPALLKWRHSSVHREPTLSPADSEKAKLEDTYGFVSLLAITPSPRIGCSAASGRKANLRWTLRYP
jgi:hypothetical protein